jgi:predicted nucleic acid-binding protein
MAAPAFLNTNLLLRHFTQDTADLSSRATALIRRIVAGEIIVRMTDTVVFETVFTLQRFYRLERAQIRNLVLPLVELSNVRLAGKRRYRRTFDLYVTLPALSFADCYHAAYMESQRLTDLITFDRDMDRVPTITRVEPDAAGQLVRASRRAHG